MALVEEARPWWMSITLGGKDDSKQTRRFNLQATDETEAATTAANIRTKLAAITAGKIISYTIEHKYVEDAYTRPTSDDAEGGEKAVISGKIDGSPLEAWSWSVPFPVIGIFLDSVGKNRNRVDIQDTALGEFVDVFRATTGAAYISDGENVGTLEEGRRI